MSTRSHTAARRTHQFRLVTEPNDRNPEPKPGHLEVWEQRLNEDCGKNFGVALLRELWHELERLRCVIPELPRKRQANASMCRARIALGMLDAWMKLRDSDCQDTSHNQIEIISRMLDILDKAGTYVFMPSKEMGKLKTHVFEMAQIEFPEAFGFPKAKPEGTT